jgi:hypothetical protein
LIELRKAATPWVIRSLTSYRRLAARHLLACALVGAFTLGMRVALIPWLHVPMPAVQDEFSYLLAADTYASGRLANPPHRFWQHFESFHILQQPTYASKYQPLPGLVLALGQKLFGQPWIGVWLSAGLMSAAICWMLQGWISPELALLGALLAAVRIGILSYWMNSYWGGAVPAIGGALLLGAIPRISLRNQFGHAVTLGIGCVILLSSRPYDGVVLSFLSVLGLAWWLWKTRLPVPTVSARVVMPIGAIVGVAAALMAYNNYRVTGNPLETPYQAHERQYAAASVFTWSPLHPQLVYRHDVMRKYWTVWALRLVTAVRDNLLVAFLIKLQSIYAFFFGLRALFVVTLIWPCALKTPQ